MRKISSFLLVLLMLCALSAAASADSLFSPDGYVTDLYGLLEPSQEQALEQRAGEISAQYERGVYIILLEDYTRFGAGDLYTVAGDIYLAGGLGRGPYHDGILLLLSMEQREAALITYDGSGQFITADGLDWLDHQYLEYFSQDAWYDGLDAYLVGCDALLYSAARGESTASSHSPGAGIAGLAASLVLGFLTALIIVAVMKSGMRSVFKASAAGAYIPPGGVELTQRHDRFLHRTTTRRKIEQPSSGGGSRSTGSRGFSGRTNKF